MCEWLTSFLFIRRLKMNHKSPKSYVLVFILEDSAATKRNIMKHYEKISKNCQHQQLSPKSLNMWSSRFRKLYSDCTSDFINILNLSELSWKTPERLWLSGIGVISKHLHRCSFKTNFPISQKLRNLKIKKIMSGSRKLWVCIQLNRKYQWIFQLSYEHIFG